uniref:Uncharacterized protein n=1 Tax=Nelumbo nucifera TaxID=4432 RepID=A0A822XK89_NELNU|nr:TPA_asm: hypothetical protein HUJ06_022243 [Nelumbo nucifera]
MATSIICSPNLTLKFPLLPHRNTPQTRFFSQHSDHIFKLRSSLSRTQPIKPNSTFKFLRFPLKPSGFPSRGNLGFSAAAKDGEREAVPVVDEAEEARGQSTMPSRFRYLTKEAPDRPVRWPWLIGKESNRILIFLLVRVYLFVKLGVVLDGTWY